MLTLKQRIPEADTLLMLNPPELGLQLLEVVRDQGKTQNQGMFHPSNYLVSGNDVHEYPEDKRDAIRRVLSEALDWLKREG